MMMMTVDAEWLDIWFACEKSGLVTWDDWCGVSESGPRADGEA